MRRATHVEITFGLFALALIYVIIANNASLTGLVISPGTGILLKSPADNTITTQTSTYFIFEYPPELEMKECSLIINNNLARTTNALLSPYDTRIRTDLKPGEYEWMIKCIDTNNTVLTSPTRRLVVRSEVKDSDLKKTKFPNRLGYLYEFELREGLELDINNVVPNDVIRVIKEGNAYEISILRIIQDYKIGMQAVELLITPGYKRIKIREGDSARIDFNNDGSADLYLVLNDAYYGKAFFTAKEKTNMVVEEGEEKEETSAKPSMESLGQGEGREEATKPEKQEPVKIQAGTSSQRTSEFFLIGIIIILLIAITLTLRTKKDEEAEYIIKLKRKSAKKNKTRKTRKKTFNKNKNLAEKKKRKKETEERKKENKEIKRNKKTDRFI